jgi:fatty-acyl-CoA synthase
VTGPSIYEVVLRSASLWPTRVAAHVLPDGSRWDSPMDITYAELAGWVTQVANVLQGLGVGRADAGGLVSPTTAELLPAMLGAQAAGVAAPVDPSLAAPGMLERLRRSRLRVLLAAGPELDPVLWEAARDLARRLDVTALLALRPTRPDRPAPSLQPLPGIAVAHLQDLAADAPRDRLVDMAAPDHRDVAAVFDTDGPGGVESQTHARAIVDAWAAAVVPGPGAGGPILAARPLFHAGTLTDTLLAPLLRGIPVVWAGPLGYGDRSLIRKIWRVVAHYRVVGMSAPPSAYAALTEVAVDADISSLRVCAVDGDVAHDVAEAWHAHTGVRLTELTRDGRGPGLRW